MFSLTLFLFVSSKRNIIEARKFVRKQKLTDDHLKNYCVDLNLLALLAPIECHIFISPYYRIFIHLTKFWDTLPWNQMKDGALILWIYSEVLLLDS